MKIRRGHWFPALLSLCAVTTVGLLLWPAASAPPPARPAGEHYRGPDIETRRAGPIAKFPLRLASPDAPASEPEIVEAVPVLVGVAGRRAYLRSAATGEVEGVPVGASIDGWRLISVSARAAILRGAGGDKRVQMFASEAAAATSGPVSGAPPPGPPANPSVPPTGG